MTVTADLKRLVEADDAMFKEIVAGLDSTSKRKPRPSKDAVLLLAQHTSLQFSDSPRQQEHDVLALFARGKDFKIKSGTEAGPGTENRTLLVKHARENNHRIWFLRDNWLAVDRDIIQRKTAMPGEVFVADNDETLGRGHDSTMLTVQWQHTDERIGEMNWGVCHRPTGWNDNKNRQIQERYARLTNQWGAKAGRGPALAFQSGDYNMPDHKTDWFFGRGFTSLGDELGYHPNTGHGPIDGFASLNKDNRVSAAFFQAFTDRQFFMHSDHFRTIGGFWVKPLKGTAA